MRTIITFILIAFLSGCNSSDDDSGLATTAQIPPSEATAVAAIRAQITVLQEQVSKFNELTLIGKPAATASAQQATPENFRTMGELTQQATPVSFGSCSNMGVLIGFEDPSGHPANALTASTQDFRQCTQYQYGANISDGSISTGERIFWDGPNCTGNLIEWEAGGAAFNTTSLRNGVVFASPFDGTILMVKAGQTAQPTLIQSVWVRDNPGCQSDIETQLMYQVSPNDVSVSGVPSGGVGAFQLGAP